MQKRHLTLISDVLINPSAQSNSTCVSYKPKAEEEKGRKKREGNRAQEVVMMMMMAEGGRGVWVYYSLSSTATELQQSPQQHKEIQQDEALTTLMTIT